MAYQYQTFPIKDFGAGVDQQSAENQLKEGYSELILNGDPEPMGYVAKRRGYQRHAGQLPVRVTKVEQSPSATNDLCLFLDSNINISSINLLKTRRTPIVVHGRTSESNTNTTLADSDFLAESDSTQYYPTFDSDVEVVFDVGTNTLSSVGLNDSNVFVHTTRRTSVVNTDNEVFFSDENRITIADGSVEVDYTNNTGSSFEGYNYYSLKTPTSGTTYFEPSQSIPDGGTTQLPIPTANHQLSNFNIDSRVYRTDGTTYTEITPDDVTIDSSGNVTIDITNNTGSSFDVVVYLTAYPALNVLTRTLLNGETNSITIPLVDTDFVGVVTYLEDVGTGSKTEVLPESIVVDSVAKTATVTFTNNTGDTTNFICYWEEIEITSNKLCLTSNAAGTATSYIDQSPQLSIWGLDHESIYGTASNSTRPGWVNHLDSYRSEGENRLVSGLGGVLYTESNDSATYGLPTLYPNLLGRVDSTVFVGPAIVATTSSRTRGYLTTDVDSNSRAKLTSVQWQSGTTVRYQFEITSFTGTFADIISSTTGLEDYVSVAGTSYPINSGTFRVVGTSVLGTTVTIDVDNPSLSCPDFDELNSSGRIGVFTDRIELTDTSRFLEGDLLDSDIFDVSDNYSVVRSQSTTLVVDGFNSEVAVAGGLRLVSQRTGRVIPMRRLDGTPDVTNVVVNDSLTRPGLDRQLTVKYINPADDQSVSITGDGTTASLVFPAMTLETNQFTIGQSILLREAGDYSGEQLITGIPDTTTLEFASTSTDSEPTATLVGKTVEVDEAMQYQDAIDDSITYRALLRWVPIEAPVAQLDSGDYTYDLTKHTYVSHLDADNYSNQSYLRSVMVSDNLYTTNGRDEVMKYDGFNYYRAGLPRWQPQLFITTTTSPASGGLIDYTPATATINAFTGNKAEVDKGEQEQFTVGQSVRDNNGNDYTITELYESESAGTTIGVIKVDDTIAGGATDFSGISFVRYYFRLNAVDVNGNRIASAITGSEDSVVEISDSTQVKLRLTGFPAWHIYDYERLEVEIYRTAVGTQAPYFKLDTIPMSFNEFDGYIDYIDSTDDELLRDDDVVSVPLVGGTDLITQASEPLRAKYITSSGNRLILANLTDYPELNIKYESTTGEPIDVTKLTTGTSRYLFRKDNTNEAPTSDLDNVQGYEFTTNSAAVTNTSITNNLDGTATIVTPVAHGLVDDQWVYLHHSAVTGERSLKYAGWFRAINTQSVTTEFDIQIDPADTYAPSAIDVNQFSVASTSTDIPVYLGIDGNYEQSSFNPSVSSDYSEVATVRLANAINCSMRLTANPWMIANAGGEFGNGQLVVRQPKVESTTLEVTLPSFSTEDYNLFVTDLRRVSEESVSAFTEVFPSRLIVSGNNYPEVFVNPRGVSDTRNQTVVDVNSADGQEITGVIPFFGDSAFGAAQKDGVLVVFKTDSIYLVKLAANSEEVNAVQRLESQGLGCTAPYSIASTRDGIMFANRSGIYKLNRQLKLDYIGRKVERLWESGVNLDQLDQAVGHHYSIGRQYKLSYPTTGDTSNSEVFVYNHTREYDTVNRSVGIGAWSQYDNHPTTGWTNLLSDAYFSTTGGAVMIIRNTEDVSDYRDDDEAINFEITMRALDFGDAGIRKVVSNVVPHFRGGIQLSTKLFSAIDMSAEFEQLDQFKVTDASRKTNSIQFAVNRRKGNYFQLKLTNDGIDESVELTAMDIRVAGLNDRAILQAARTT